MPRGARVVVLLALALLACLPGAALAQAPPPPPPPPPVADPPAYLGVNSEKGRIDLAMIAPKGAKVEFFERVAGGLVFMARRTAEGDDPILSVILIDITKWRCDRLVRRFTAVATAPSGKVTTAERDIRTPSCRDRLEVLVPARLARGDVLPVTVADRFALGGTTATVCAGKRGARARCQTLALTEERLSAIARFRVGGDAVWRVRVRHPRGRIERVLTVGDARRPTDLGLPSLLITGDSLIQGIDAYLSDRLQTGFDVTSDTRPGSRLVRPSGFEWPVLARSHVRRVLPSVTVLSLGINDGAAIDGEECCSAAWSAAYAKRARSLMRIYARGGRGRVLWFTLPTPRDPRFAKVARAVNVGIRLAAAGQERVTLVDLAELLTPNDTYRDVMSIAGRRVRVRAGDGIHLSAAGAQFVAAVVVDTLRRFRSTG